LQALRDSDRLIVESVLPHSPGQAGRTVPGFWENLGGEAEAIVPELVRLLEEEPPLRGSAIRALGVLGPIAGDAAPALIDVVRDEKARERAYAATVLPKIGADRDLVVPLLIDLLNDPSGSVVWASADMLREHYPEAARSIVPLLAERLKDDAPEVRSRAAHSLHVLGPLAEEAIPEMVDALSDRAVTGSIALALGRHGSRARRAVPAMVELLRERNAQSETSIVRALGEIGPDARAAVPVLRDLLERNCRRLEKLDGTAPHQGRPSHNDFWACEQIVIALGRIGIADDEEARQWLVRATRLSWPDIRSAALWALVVTDHDADELLPLLVEALQEPYSRMRLTAAWGLGRLAIRNEVTVPLLTQALADEDPLVRTVAARSLGAFGPEAAEAVPVLLALLEDEANARPNRPFPNFSHLIIPPPAKRELYQTSVRDAVHEALERINTF
jgi:HEAT repeat protein